MMRGRSGGLPDLDHCRACLQALRTHDIIVEVREGIVTDERDIATDCDVMYTSVFLFHLDCLPFALPED
jgi:hypothetical protein